jgi:hypothetical protein
MEMFSNQPQQSQVTNIFSGLGTQQQQQPQQFNFEQNQSYAQSFASSPSFSGFQQNGYTPNVQQSFNTMNQLGGYAGGFFADP